MSPQMQVPSSPKETGSLGLGQDPRVCLLTSTLGNVMQGAQGARLENHRSTESFLLALTVSSTRERGYLQGVGKRINTD